MRLTAGALLAASILFIATAAQAQSYATESVANAPGLGASATLGGTGGVHFRYFVTPQLGIETTLGLSFTNDTNEVAGMDVDTTNIGLRLALYGLYRFAIFDKATLGFLFGVDMGLSSTSSGGGSANNDLDFGGGLGLHAEVFPTQFLSFFCSGGLAITFLGDDDAGRYAPTLGSDDASGIDLTIASDLFGGAGFTVWFK